jgi:bifunctional non-homologous end joining protein LigD
MESVPGRLAQKDDPWSNLTRHARSIASRREKLDELLDQEEPAEEERD